MSIQCPVDTCGTELIANEDAPRVRASLRCPSTSHSLFYDRESATYFVTNPKVLTQLAAKGLKTKQIPASVDFKHITSKGNLGEKRFETFVRGRNPNRLLVHLGKGAAADYFLYDSATKAFWFVEVKSSLEQARLDNKLSPPEEELASKIIAAGIPYLVAWFEGDSDQPELYTLDAQHFLQRTNPP